MDKSLLKLILLISAFLGVVFGILTATPYIGEIAFWILLCFAAVIEMLFLMKVKLLELFTVNESAVIGGIIGFVSFFNYSTNYGVSMILGNANFGILLILSVFMSVLSATINAFTGFITFYIKEFIKTLDKNEEKRRNIFK